MNSALTGVEQWRAQFEPLQKDAFDYTFANFPQSAPKRAAGAIVSYLKNGRIEDDFA